VNENFRRAADVTAHAVGTPLAFLIAIAVVLVWALSGHFFGYSDTWQLVINTGTTIITFLMVFLIQSTQNRDTRIINLKLDELLRGVEGARTGFSRLNDLSDADLEEVQQQFIQLTKRFAPLVEDDLAEIELELAARRQRSGAKRAAPKSAPI
jgi:low affinity Fe/Cu permease